jgi:hypothetical protein
MTVTARDGRNQLSKIAEDSLEHKNSMRPAVSYIRRFKAQAGREHSKPGSDASARSTAAALKPSTSPYPIVVIRFDNQ